MKCRPVDWVIGFLVTLCLFFISNALLPVTNITVDLEQRMSEFNTDQFSNIIDVDSATDGAIRTATFRLPIVSATINPSGWAIGLALVGGMQAMIISMAARNFSSKRNTEDEF